MEVVNEAKFTCRDCKKELPISDRINYDIDSFYDVCFRCIDKYPNPTGNCSCECRLSGTCDESC